MGSEELGYEELKRQRDFLLNVVLRVACSDKSNEKFSELVLQETKEAASFIEERLI